MKLLLLWLAFSIRSPNIEPNPFDYEISGGYETQVGIWKSNSKVLFERENGGKYTGWNTDNDLKYVKLDSYVRTAKDISQQKLVAKYPWTIGEFGASLGLSSIWNDWSEPTVGLYGNLKCTYGSVEIAGLKQVEMCKAKVKYTFSIHNGLFLEPYGTIYYTPDKVDYQAKIKVGYKWAK